MTTPTNEVDAFLAALPEEQRVALEKLRQAIRGLVPDAVELINYGIPMFKYRGKGLVGFGAAKNQCSFYVMSPAVMEAFRGDLAGYSTAKGTVHFPAAKPLPAALVKKLVKARIAEESAPKQAVKRP